MSQTPTPIAELVDYCRAVNTRLDAIGFDPALDAKARRDRAAAVMEEFIGLAERVCAAYAGRPDSQHVFALVQRLRRRMSAWTKLTAQSPGDLEAKSGRWVKAMTAVKQAWFDLDGLRAVRPGSGDARRDGRAKGKGRGAPRKRTVREAPTHKQVQAYVSYVRTKSIRATAGELGISYEAARKLVNRAKALVDARGRSVRTRRLPTDERGQVRVPD